MFDLSSRKNSWAAYSPGRQIRQGRNAVAPTRKGCWVVGKFSLVFVSIIFNGVPAFQVLSNGGFFPFIQIAMLIFNVRNVINWGTIKTGGKTNQSENTEWRSAPRFSDVFLESST